MHTSRKKKGKGVELLGSENQDKVQAIETNARLRTEKITTQ